MLGSVDKLIAAAEDTDIELLLVDLQLPGLDLGALSKVLKERFAGDGKRAIGYAQHVEVELLDSAQDCGFSAVLTRGQMNGSLQRLFGEI